MRLHLIGVIAGIVVAAGLCDGQSVYVSSVISGSNGTLAMQGCTDMTYSDTLTYSAEADVFPNGSTSGSASQTGSSQTVCATAYQSASINQSYWVQTNHWMLAPSGDPRGYGGVSPGWYTGSGTVTGVAHGAGNYYIASSTASFSTYGSAPSVSYVDETSYGGPAQPGNWGYVILYGSNLAATWASNPVSASIPGVSTSVTYASPGQVNVYYLIPSNFCPSTVTSTLSTPYGATTFPFSVGGPACQTITFAQPANTTVGSSAALSASASSGLAVTFSADTPSICSVSGAAATGVAAGTCTVRAKQAGNAQWQAAADVTRSLTVAGASPITITNNSLPAGVVGSTYSVALAATGGSGGYTWSATGLPAGLTVSGPAIIGTPSSSQGSPFSVTITVHDSSGGSGNKTLALTIGALREYIRMGSQVIWVENK